MYRNRKPSLPTGVGLVIFLIIAAVLASGIARVIGFLFHLVFQVVWYAIAFVIAVALLSLIWDRLTHTRALTRSQWDRETDGRRRY